MAEAAPARAVLVTGARKGIGRHLAERFCERGWSVAGCSRGPSDLARPNYLHVEADVGDEAAVAALLRRVQEKFGRLDAVVNNAGVASMNHSLLVPGKTFDQVMGTNARGTFLVSRESAKLMRRTRSGRIVNLTTVAVPLALEGEAIYAASKAAVEMLTRVMARELAPMGITVNALGPTPIETDLIRGVPKEKLDRLVASLPIKRLGRMEDVLNVVDFFLDEKSSFVTGQVIYLGGA